MAAKIYLPVTDDIEGCAVLVPMSNGSLLRGNEDENLACGACKTVLARGVSTRTINQRYQAEKALLVRCTCGAHNVLPATIKKSTEI